MGLGQAGYTFVQSLTGDPLIDGLMVFSAEYLVFLVPLVLSYIWLQGEEGRKESLFGLTSVIAGISATYLVGLFYYHQPPQFQGFETILAKEMENAFPSQHAATVFSMAWPLAYRERYRLASLVFTAAVLTGFARVYTGLHFPVDIAGAVPASLLGFGFAYLLEDRIGELARVMEDMLKESR